MALDINSPQSLYAIQEPPVRRFPADEALRQDGAEKLMATLRRKVKEFRGGGHAGAPARCKIAVKVVDIFGNDTITIVGENR